MNNKKKFLSLETFRGFAALMIAAIHFDVNSPLVNHSLANGYFVQFFFCLSGFVIYYNYRDKIKNLTNIKVFIIKRFFRLYPLHLFFLLLFLFIEIVKYIAINEFKLSPNSEPFTKNNFYTFVANIFLLQTFLYEYTFNTPSWSISAEFYTYIVFAFIIIFKFNLRISLFVLLLISLIRINDQLNFGASHSGYRSFLDCIYSFYWGLFSSYLYVKYNDKKLYKITKNTISFILLFVTFISLTKMQDDNLFILPIIFSLLIFFSCDLNNTSFLGKILCNKFFVYLGSISYSIYMSHLLIFWIITNSLKYIFNLNTFVDDDGFSKLDLNIFVSSLLVLFCYFVTIIFSHFLYNYIEKKYNRF